MKKIIIIFLAFTTICLLGSPRDLLLKSTKDLPPEIDEVMSYVGPIERAQKELMSVAALPEAMRYKLMLVITSGTECLRCTCEAVRHLKDLKISREEISALQTNLQKAAITEKDRALLVMAREITLRPSTSMRHVTQAQEVGWSDRELSNAILIASHFNMKTRILMGFDLGPDRAHPYKRDQKFPMVSCP